MPRPFAYTTLHEDMYGHLETQVIGIDRMYGIKHDEKWVVVATVDTTNKRTQRKYNRPFLATRIVVEKKAAELNQRYHTNKYRVVEI